MKETINEKSTLRAFGFECSMEKVKAMTPKQARELCHAVCEQFRAIPCVKVAEMSYHDKDHHNDMEDRLVQTPMHVHGYVQTSNPIHATTVMKILFANGLCKEETAFNVLEREKSKTQSLRWYLVHAHKKTMEEVEAEGKYPYFHADDDWYDRLDTIVSREEWKKERDKKVERTWADPLQQEAIERRDQAEADARLIDSAGDGIITPNNYTEFMDCKTYVRIKHKLETAWAYREQVLHKEEGNNRNMECMYIWGESESGKTTFAKAMCKNRYPMLSVYVASGGDHPFDEYNGEEIIILDDFRSTKFRLSDMLLLTDNDTLTAVNARYRNKSIRNCQLLIITSVWMIEEVYKTFKETEEGDKKAKQFFRRFKSYIKVNGMTVYPHVDGSKWDKCEFDIYVFEDYKKRLAYQSRPVLEIPHKEKRFRATDLFAPYGQVKVDLPMESPQEVNTEEEDLPF